MPGKMTKSQATEPQLTGDSVTFINGGHSGILKIVYGLQCSVTVTTVIIFVGLALLQHATMIHLRIFKKYIKIDETAFATLNYLRTF